MTTPNLTQEEIAKIINNPALRRELAQKDIRYFFALYFFRYINYPPAPFHDDFLNIAADDDLPLAVILAFRGSAKSTIFSLCYPIWAVTGKAQKKFVLIITQTQSQARKIMDNIKTQLESNEMLKADIGPFTEEGNEWSSMSIVIKQYDARIMVASTEQSIRGLLHLQYRPDVIILDDIEDLASVKSQEGRDKLFDWYTGDVVPLGDRNTRHILLGTRLHPDDLPSRLISQIKAKERQGVYKIVPIVKNKKNSWPGKYPDRQAIKEEIQKVGNRIAWEREYMLRLISPEDQLIKPEWITYYDELPPLRNLSRIVVGIDLAIQQKETSDYTSMIVVYAFGKGKKAQYYIAKPIINKRMTLHQMADTARQLYDSLPAEEQTFFVVEDVGYQLAAVEELKENELPVEGTKVHGQDKYTRASIVSSVFEQKRIHFPATGSKPLIDQLTGFPNESHDDMVDALVYALLKIQEEERKPEPRIRWL